jgi:hypothetical protein
MIVFCVFSVNAEMTYLKVNKDLLISIASFNNKEFEV